MMLMRKKIQIALNVVCLLTFITFASFPFYYSETIEHRRESIVHRIDYAHQLHREPYYQIALENGDMVKQDNIGTLKVGDRLSYISSIETTVKDKEFALKFYYSCMGIMLLSLITKLCIDKDKLYFFNKVE